MREDELKQIVEVVVRVLAERGVVGKSGGCGCGPAAPKSYGGPPSVELGGSASVRVTTGTAGKVFSDSPTPAPSQSPAAQFTDLRQAGADRIGVCNPSKECNAIAPMVDHTLLKPGATQEEVAKLCEEARSYCFASVCVNPAYVSLAAQLLKGSGVKVCTVVGFPLGSTTPTVKAIEARDAIASGAEEIDMVINVGAIKSGNDALVLEDIKAVREASRGHVLKVILETALLTDDEKVRACRASKEAGADFVKTSTGFGPGGATPEDVALMRQTVGPLMGVKASGGIRDSSKARKMIEAGATRLGTSASVGIVTDQKASGKGY